MNIPVETLLLERGLLTERQLRRAMEFRERCPDKALEEILLDFGYVSEAALLACLGERDGLEVVMEQQPMDMRELAGLLNKKGERTIFLGDGVPVYKDIIREMLTVPHAFAPAQMNRQRAASVAALGMNALLDAEGCPGVRVVTAAQFTPDYLRKPQAERQREAEQSALGAAAKLPGDY